LDAFDGQGVSRSNLWRPPGGTPCASGYRAPPRAHGRGPNNLHCHCHSSYFMRSFPIRGSPYLINVLHQNCSNQ
jgi:hypothetical protein